MAAQITPMDAIFRTNAARLFELDIKSGLTFREMFLMRAYAFEIVMAPLVFCSGFAQAGVECSLVEPLASTAKPFE